MTIEEIYTQTTDPAERLQKINEQNKLKNETGAAVKEYNGDRKLRKTQVGNRTDRKLKSGDSVDVSRIPWNFQKNITRTAAAILMGKPVRIQAAGGEDISELVGEWNRVRMPYFLLKACERAKAYRQSAILFRKVGQGQDERIAPVVLDPKQGDLIPLWAEWDVMDAFVYSTRVKETIDGEEKEVVITYVFQETQVETYRQVGDEITTETAAHGFDRIPVVYFEEEEVEYEDVKTGIDSFEMRYSRLVDTNDYFGAPILKALGDVDEVPSKDQDGEMYLLDIIEVEGGGVVQSDIDVVSWDSQIESVKLELETGRRLIYDLSMTPDLSFENVKGIGSLSGTALGMMFLQSQIKAAYSWPLYKIGVERALNIFRNNYNGASFEGVVFDIQRQEITPQNLQETISTLSEAAFNKPIMSQRTAVAANPLVQDPTAEMTALDEEAAGELGGSLNLEE